MNGIVRACRILVVGWGTLWGLLSMVTLGAFPIGLIFTLLEVGGRKPTAVAIGVLLNMFGAFGAWLADQPEPGAYRTKRRASVEPEL